MYWGVLNCYIQPHGGAIFSLTKEYLFSPSILVVHFIILVFIKASNCVVTKRFNSQVTKGFLLLAQSCCRKVSGKSNITSIIKVNMEQHALARQSQYHCAEQRKPC